MGRAFGLLVAVVGWASLILQLYLIVSGKGIQVPGYEPTLLTSIVNFFSYFTILSNILASLLATTAVLAPQSGLGRFFERPVVAATVAMAMIVTGLIYTVVLRHMWQPVGLQFVADSGLHYVMPPLFALYWLTVVPRDALRLANIPSMLIYPLVYVVYSLIRGPLADWYPYPFLSVKDLGWGQVIINMIGIAVLFAVIGAILVGLDRLLNRNPRAA